MRIRINKKPRSIDMAEFDVRALVVGETIDVSARLATCLIVSGCAEPVGEAEKRSEAADEAPRRRRKDP